MEKYMFMILGIVLGIGIALYVYAVKRERYAKLIANDRECFSTKKLDMALDNAVRRMQLEMKALGRKLTDEEKNEIIFSFLEQSKRNEVEN